MREFWVTRHIIGDSTGGKQHWAFPNRAEYFGDNVILCREVSPEYDALVEEMVALLKEGYSTDHENVDTLARRMKDAVNKLEAFKAKGEKE